MFFWLKAVRWTYLLRPIKTLKTTEVVPALMIGFMMNNVLPAHLGEFVRVYVLGRQYDIPKSAVLSTVVLERIFDVFAILAFLGISLALVDLPPEFKTGGIIITSLAIVGFIGVLAFVIWPKPILAAFELTLGLFWFVPVAQRRKLVELVETSSAGLATLKDPWLTFLIAVTSVAQWLINGGMVYFSLKSFGLDLPLLASFVVIAATALGVTVPSTPGYFGVVQACFRISLLPFGADEAQVVSASVYYHLVQYVAITLVGLIFLNRVGMKFSDLSHKAIDAEDAAGMETDVPVTS